MLTGDDEQALVLGGPLDDPDFAAVRVAVRVVHAERGRPGVDGFLSWSRIGWSAGCRMYVQPKSAKAAR